MAHVSQKFAFRLIGRYRRIFGSLQRLFALFAIRNIGADANMPQEFAGRREARLRIGGYPAPLTVRTPDAPLGSKRRPVSNGAKEAGDVLRAIIRMNAQTPLITALRFERDVKELAADPVGKLRCTFGIRY